MRACSSAARCRPLVRSISRNWRASAAPTAVRSRLFLTGNSPAVLVGCTGVTQRGRADRGAAQGAAMAKHFEGRLALVMAVALTVLVAGAARAQVVCGDGVLAPGEQCDEGLANGSAGSCCNADCTFRSAGAICRSAADACDADELCSGVDGACPADALQPLG